jgi:hypothetical protein
MKLAAACGRSSEDREPPGVSHERRHRYNRRKLSQPQTNSRLRRNSVRFARTTRASSRGLLAAAHTSFPILWNTRTSAYAGTLSSAYDQFSMLS